MGEQIRLWTRPIPPRPVPPGTFPRVASSDLAVMAQQVKSVADWMADLAISLVQLPRPQPGAALGQAPGHALRWPRGVAVAAATPAPCDPATGAAAFRTVVPHPANRSGGKGVLRGAATVC